MANLESKRKANQQGYSTDNLKKKCQYYYRPKHLNSNTHKHILDNWKFTSTRDCFFFDFIFTIFLIFFLELFRQFSGNSTIHYSTTQRVIPSVKRHVHLNMQINGFHRFHWPVSSWDSSASLMAKYLARWSTTKKKLINKVKVKIKLVNWTYSTQSFFKTVKSILLWSIQLVHLKHLLLSWCNEFVEPPSLDRDL